MTFDTDKIPRGWCEFTPRLAPGGPWGTAFVDGGGRIKKPLGEGILKWIYYIRPRDRLECCVPEEA